ncbi:hypothetical protein PLAN_100670 [Planktothrix rubescens CCAP 1459/22]|uniref:Uncharacterized protein n=1 Tax=Planktothrix rubescens CCAP 1459/22 TaxID=329571 RepID=A0A6J7ZFY0_PLARU|nr:hypothetical protein PLAN_100670 [Planktothrix rubescens NIVA-CYA 18]
MCNLSPSPFPTRRGGRISNIKSQRDLGSITPHSLAGKGAGGLGLRIQKGKT